MDNLKRSETALPLEERTVVVVRFSTVDSLVVLVVVDVVVVAPPPYLATTRWNNHGVPGTVSLVGCRDSLHCPFPPFR